MLLNRTKMSLIASLFCLPLSIVLSHSRFITASVRAAAGYRSLSRALKPAFEQDSIEFSKHIRCNEV
ncbi:MAG: hypothetical protein JSU68_02110 [Phycisphaerales bacterium]|nr:MAG: hypothetical protein JSU68_02110 [Phycisphaerales bacterium]